MGKHTDKNHHLEDGLNVSEHWKNKTKNYVSASTAENFLSNALDVKQIYTSGNINKKA